MERSRKETIQNIAAIAFWLLVWQLVSVLLHSEILLVSPFVVFKRMLELMGTSAFWSSVLLSLFRILLGLLMGSLLGFVCAVLAQRFSWVKVLLSPFVVTIKSVPVASFIILILVWVSSRKLSTVISFLMVFPIVYESLSASIMALDKGMLEVAKVFQLSRGTVLKKIWFPQLLPYVLASGPLAIGLAFKSGIAAEVIGLPDLSIGDALYKAKIYLDTADLLAWTVVIILLSIGVQKLFMGFLEWIVKRTEQAL